MGFYICRVTFYGGYPILKTVFESIWCTRCKSAKSCLHTFSGHCKGDRSLLTMRSGMIVIEFVKAVADQMSWQHGVPSGVASISGWRCRLRRREDERP